MSGSFDSVANAGRGYKPLEPRRSSSGGMTPLNLSEPIGHQTLGETKEDVQRRAISVYQAAAARGAPQKELDRLLAMVENSPDQYQLNPLEPLFVLPTLLRFKAINAIPGGLTASTEDFDDVINLNSERMRQRHFEQDAGKEHTQDTWGRSGEYRGTDWLEDMGWDYAPSDVRGPWDEGEGFVRFIASMGLDVISDPQNFFTGGGAGIARAPASQAAATLQPSWSSREQTSSKASAMKCSRSTSTISLSRLGQRQSCTRRSRHRPKPRQG